MRSPPGVSRTLHQCDKSTDWDSLTLSMTMQALFAPFSLYSHCAVPI